MSRPHPIPSDSLPQGAFRRPYRIRFHECDPAGIVFFAAWFAIAHSIVEEFLDHIGVPFAALNGPRRTGTGLAHASADFFAPGRFGETVTVTPLVARVGSGSYRLVVHVHRDVQELVRLTLVSATTDLETGRAIPLPDDLRSALSCYQERCSPCP